MATLTGAEATWTLEAMVSVTAATGVGAARRTRATATAATTSAATHGQGRSAHEVASAGGGRDAVAVSISMSMSESGSAEGSRCRPCGDRRRVGHGRHVGRLLQRSEVERRHHRLAADPGCSTVVQTIELVDGHQYLPRLGALARADHSPALEQVHQPPGTGEAHPELPLQHGCGP